jgi:formylglycine-generating enzyme required for sulfatase activity
MRHVQRLISASGFFCVLMGAGLGCSEGGAHDDTPGPKGDPGPQGLKGDKGDKGDPGGIGSAGCPVDYTLASAASDLVVCKKGDYDEIVKVGTGGSAFFIDRYEASVWSTSDGSGQQYGAMGDDYPTTFPKNGQWTTKVYALSKVGVLPSRQLTWFQASEACLLSGKRLPARHEWLAAARGTKDSGANPGDSGACATQAAGPRKTGLGADCQSGWGAQDMIGNVSEWTDEWYAGVGNADLITRPWPDASYGDDGTWNIASKAFPAMGPPVQGIPAAAQRGGDFGGGTAAGIFHFALHLAPSNAQPEVGFRCVVPR